MATEDRGTTAAPSAEGTGTIAARYGPLVAIVLASAGMLLVSWGKWPDVLVDFGRELYVPWQLSAGKVLGRDLEWYVTGPPSPYLNALLFRALGPSLRVLVAFNLGLLACLTWLLYDLLRQLAGRFGATAGCLVFVLLFAFGQYVGTGNYNYVTPYSHGATHGMLLSLTCIWLLARHARTGSRASLALAGITFGLVFLTKPELFVACTAAVGVAALYHARGGLTARGLRGLLLFGAAAALPTAVTFALLARSLGLAAGWQTTLAPWLLATRPGVAGNAFYRQGMGIDRAAENARALASVLGMYAACIAIPVALDLALGARLRARRLWAEAAFGIAALALFLLAPQRVWSQVARPLPVVALLVGAGYLLGAVRAHRPDGPSEAGSRLLLGMMFSAFACGTLLKMVLNARVQQYGFVLAMPASVLLAATLAGTIPDLLRRVRGGGALARGALCGIVAVVVAQHVRTTASAYARKVYPVGAGADRFLADRRGQFVAEMIGRIEAQPGATLAVLPEGVMINYLTRRPSSVRYLSFLSDSLAYYGSETPILAAYQRAPPDLVLLVHRDSGEYGPRFFGRDYALETASWIRTQYRPLERLGAPLQGTEYRMLLLGRHPPPGPAFPAQSTER